MRIRFAVLATLAVVQGALAQSAAPEGHEHHHAMDMAMPPPAAAPEGYVTAPPDPRQRVRFPPDIRRHVLANMRDHLTALEEIHVALAAADYTKAADVAEKRLGMSSMALHGAHESAPFMPEGMQKIGAEMHHAASRFAIEAQTASATGDVRPVLAALGGVMRQCVSCHTSYRVQ